MDFFSVNILQQLVEEEKDAYTNLELKAIYKFLQLKNKALVRNEVKLEYLLSFN